MADDKVTLGIEVETSAAEKSLKSLEKTSQDSAARMQKAFDGLKTVAAAAIAVFAGRAVVNFFEEGIASAVAQEQAFARLGAQLDATGENSASAVKAFGDLADELEATTKFGDDAVIAAAALAKSFGITNDQALGLTRTAADLASATGDTLEGAVTQLTNSYSGNIKSIGKLVPEIKGLTKEQLAAGDAVGLLAKRFAGAANKEIQTYQGAIIQAGNAFDNFRESFGKVLVENKGVTASIAAVSKIFQSFQKITDENSQSLGDFINLGVKSLVTGLTLVLPVLKFVTKGIEGFAFGITLLFTGILEAITPLAEALDLLPGSATSTADALDEIKDRSTAASKAILSGFGGVTKAIDETSVAADKVAQSIFDVTESTDSGMKKAEGSTKGFSRAVVLSAEEVAKLREEGRKFLESLTSSGASESEKVVLDATKSFNELGYLAKKGALTQAQSREASFKITQIQIQKTNTLIEKSLKETAEKAAKAAQDARSAIETAANDPIKFAVAKLEIPPIAVSLDTAQIGSAGLGVISKILDGAAGAKSLISAGASAFGDALIPGIGGVVGGIFSKLAEGPDATKKFVTEFVKAIPVIVTAIAEAAPVFVEVLVDTLVNQGGAVKIGLAIARAMSGEAILKNIGKQIGLSFGSSFNGDTIGRKIASGFLTIGDKLVATFTNLGSLLYNSIFGGFIAGGQQILATLQTGINNFIGLFSTLGETIITPIRDFFTTGITDLINAAFEPITTLFRTDMPTLILSAFQPVIDFFNSLKVEAPQPIKQVQKSLSTGDKNTDAALLAVLTGGASVPFTLAGGGIVYAAGGFKPRGTDTVPAMLTPGEMVLNKGQQGELFNLANGGSGNLSNSMLQEIIDLLSNPQTTAVTAQVNGKAIADIVLQQSRQRARLQA